MICPHCGGDTEVVCSVEWNEEGQIWIAESSNGTRLASKDYVHWTPYPKDIVSKDESESEEQS
jgi:hypothetical protein